MKYSEFDVIEKYFTFSNQRRDVHLAVGDDCAMVSVANDKRLAITTDTLISGVHFPENAAPEDIAYKALMVSFSDLAAMGAKPAWVTLAISLPGINDAWLSSFSNQFSAILKIFNVALIGGDTTKGTLSITIQAMGFCDKEKILRRDQAKLQDKIYVTGYLGDAAIGLHAVLNNIDDKALSHCINKLNRPMARVNFAQELRDISVCAIDISDGLVADLGHILKASNCGADINLLNIPLSSAAQTYFENYHNSRIDWSTVLTQGDDYELCFTCNSNNETALNRLADRHQLKVTCIGEITNTNRLNFFNADSELVDFENEGYKHF